MRDIDKNLIVTTLNHQPSIPGVLLINPFRELVAMDLVSKYTSSKLGESQLIVNAAIAVGVTDQVIARLLK
jgi:hypothetical protein